MLASNTTTNIGAFIFPVASSNQDTTSNHFSYAGSISSSFSSANTLRSADSPSYFTYLSPHSCPHRLLRLGHLL